MIGKGLYGYKRNKGGYGIGRVEIVMVRGTDAYRSNWPRQDQPEQIAILRDVLIVTMENGQPRFEQRSRQTVDLARLWRVPDWSYLEPAKVVEIPHED